MNWMRACEIRNTGMKKSQRKDNDLHRYINEMSQLKIQQRAKRKNNGSGCVRKEQKLWRAAMESETEVLIEAERDNWGHSGRSSGRKKREERRQRGRQQGRQQGRRWGRRGGGSGGSGGGGGCVSVEARDEWFGEPLRVILPLCLVECGGAGSENER